MKFTLVPALAFLVASFAGVHAQNVSQCVLDCISQAATANGCDLTNTQCLCTNSKLQQAALTCLQQSCTAQDLQNAESLVQTECSFSFPPLSSTGSTGSGSGSGASASATSPAATQTQSQSQSQSQSQNAAAHTKAKLGAAVVAVAVGAVVAL